MGSRSPHRQRVSRALLTLVAAIGWTTLANGQLLLPAQVHPSAPFPFSGGQTEPGVPFPLPQEVDPHGRRVTKDASNALAISWDGKLIMYHDSGDGVWSDRPDGTDNLGYLFATFKKDAITNNAGQPDFSAAFGVPLARFAETENTTDPIDPSTGQPKYPGNDYPDVLGVTQDFYPHILPNPGSKVGSTGELGLLRGTFLSNLLYPVPASTAEPHLIENPFASDASGLWDADGTHKTYDMYVTFQDVPQFWDGSRWRGFDPANYTSAYEYDVTYPNGLFHTKTNTSIKRNGRSRLRVVVDGNGEVSDVIVVERYEPFRVDDASWTTPPSAVGGTVGLSVPSKSEMYLDTFEPTMTLDGHLLVGKAYETMMAPPVGGGGSRVVFFYNQTAFGVDNWQGPWELHKMYLLKDTVVGGQTLAERYPICRRPIKNYDGKVLGDTNGDGDLSWGEADLIPFEGGYPWLSHDGRFVVYTVSSGGVGKEHPSKGDYPTTFVDGGGSSNRAQTTIVGSVTNWQCWRIDHAAPNPSRHYFTAFDQDSRTVTMRTASFGFGPGFWDMLRGADALPLTQRNATRIQLVDSNRLRYYEVDVSPAQERDYGFYLPMTILLSLAGGPDVDSLRREVDITRTPDFSGNGHTAFVEGGQLPCEHFELPSLTNFYGNMFGLYIPAASPSQIHPTWTSADTVQDGNGDYWARLADFESGVDENTLPGGDDGLIDTLPYEGLGLPRDMDNDICWGRVGQAMFFGNSSQVRIDNSSLPPEINPGTTVAGAANELSATLWVRPLQNRTGAARLLDHHVHIELRKGATIGGAQRGLIAVGVEDPNGTIHWLKSQNRKAPLHKWTHVAMTWRDTEDDRSALRLYVDGVEVPNSPLSLAFDTLKTNTGDVRIGCLNSAATQPDQAVLLLDEVALKNSDLTPEETLEIALQPVPDPVWDPSNLPPAPAPFSNDDAKVPVSSPYDANIAKLGADLFHDVQLSENRDTSCATCHLPEQAFANNEITVLGTDGLPLLRNTPTIYNQRFETAQFWDARVASLEDQALLPILNKLEMGLDWIEVDQYLEEDPDYLSRFNQYLQAGGDITKDHVRRSLATYMRALTTGNSPADQVAAGLSATVPGDFELGRQLFFGKARCVGCHNGPNFTDGRLWTTGTFNDSDLGAFEPFAAAGTADRARFRGAFKTPTLRELTRTGPYFHDGKAASLLEVVEFYNAGGVRADGTGPQLLDPEHDVVAEEINRPLGLESHEIDALVSYLNSLAGETVDDGPDGFNQPPTVAFTTVTTTFGFPPVAWIQQAIDVVDPDGASDLDPDLPWTLSITNRGNQYDWSSGTVTSIPGGYRYLPGGFLTGRVTANAADKHGLWGDPVIQ